MASPSQLLEQRDAPLLANLKRALDQLYEQNAAAAQMISALQSGQIEAVDSLVGQITNNFSALFTDANEIVEALRAGDYTTADVNGPVAFAPAPLVALHLIVSGPVGWSPAPAVLIGHRGSVDDIAIARVLAWDPETSVLSVEIVSNVGSVGPHGDSYVQVGLLSSIAEGGMLASLGTIRDQIASDRDAVSGDRTVVHDDKVAAAGAAGVAISAANQATALVGAAATALQPSDMYPKTRAALAGINVPGNVSVVTATGNAAPGDDMDGISVDLHRSDIHQRELLLNGGFEWDDDWIKGPGWTISGEQASADAGSPRDLAQTVALVAGAEYEVRFTLSGVADGGVYPVFGGGTVVSGTLRSADGTYTERMTAAAGNTFFALRDGTGEFAGSVDDISLRRIVASGYLPDANATNFAYLSRTITLGKMLHGASSNGRGDNKAALEAAITEVAEKGGGALKFPAGMYMSSGTPQSSQLFRGSIEIEWHPEATLRGTPGFEHPLISLYGGPGVNRHDGRITLNAPRIDCSRGNQTGGGGARQPSAINLRNYRDVIINDPDLYGGQLYTNGGTGGDSGIEPINVWNFQCRGGRIRGFGDAGIYAGGGNDQSNPDPDGGGTYLLDGTFIEHCAVGFVFKRRGYLATIQGASIYDCCYGVATADVGPEGGLADTGAGQRLHVLGSYFKRCGETAIQITGGTKGRLVGNSIEDVGYSEIGAGTVVSLGLDRAFIVLNGSRNTQLSDNYLEMLDQAVTDQIGIKVKPYTDQGGVTWQAGAARGSGNTIRNVPRPFVDAGSSNTQSILTGNFLDGAFTSPFGSIVHGTVFEYQVIGSTTNLTYAQRRSDAGLGVATRYVNSGAFVAG
ncbi:MULTISPECIES: hypothetical protein [unclassified Shinella]|uniref:hypothetical protein n=1 Tax=unclassified Shinella TaxID=2643062 RepID=UPI00225D6C4E|nr:MULTISPECIES: hypothetical protein [unclassified Shinella]MCO5138988.1 hypothetical protein [Shinella sp.]MDC7256283.1 hypothetical protein [Shinella sp. YE25]CAI0339141.1 hypothetical protein SHINE37_42995 [Rhizobiaceae bacterium]CAK7257556.1 protein of unknown function [Shinella sp. WSC3-e]